MNLNEVEISVSHVTEPGEGWVGKRLIAVCSNIEELNEVLNNPQNSPELYWLWKIEFQERLEEIK